MTQPSRHRIWNSSPGRAPHISVTQVLRNNLSLRVSGENYFVYLKLEGQSCVLVRDLRLAKQAALTTALEFLSEEWQRGLAKFNGNWLRNLLRKSASDMQRGSNVTSRYRGRVRTSLLLTSIRCILCAPVLTLRLILWNFLSIWIILENISMEKDVLYGRSEKNE